MTCVDSSQLQNQLDTNLHLSASVPTEEKKTQTPKITKVFGFLMQTFISWRRCVPTWGRYSLSSPTEVVSAVSDGFTKCPEAQENAFCCRKGKKEAAEVILSPEVLLLMWLWSAVAVDQPQPFGPRQRSKHPPHDEAPPALAVWTGERSAQTRACRQEKPPGRIPLPARQEAERGRSVSGLALQPAPSSAGRARSHDLVRKRFRDFFLLCVQTFCKCFFFFYFIFFSVSIRIY